jgi:hypothetical protein
LCDLLAAESRRAAPRPGAQPDILRAQAVAVSEEEFSESVTVHD